MKMLAVLGFVLLASTAALGQKMDANAMKEMQETCKKESGFTGTVMEIKSEGASKEEKCYLGCVMTKRNILKKDGTFDVELNKQYMEALYTGDLKDALVKASNFCLNEVKPILDDPCETAYKVFQCKQQQMAAAKKS